MDKGGNFHGAMFGGTCTGKLCLMCILWRNKVDYKYNVNIVDIIGLYTVTRQYDTVTE